jgi:hypothetical protein
MPDLSTVGELNIPGWKEDANSPFSATNTISTTFTFDQEYHYVQLRPMGGGGFDQLQINGITQPDYYYRDNGDDATTNDTKFDIGAEIPRCIKIELAGEPSGNLRANVTGADDNGSIMAHGRILAGGKISSIRLFDSVTSRDIELKVYGWNP